MIIIEIVVASGTSNFGAAVVVDQSFHTFRVEVREGPVGVTENLIYLALSERMLRNASPSQIFGERVGIDSASKV
jgi:hypothetical protein